MATKVTIDTSALGLTFTAGTDYRIELEEGFVIESGNNETPNLADTNVFTFTTNSTGPDLSSSVPADNAVDIGGVVSVVFNFNRFVTLTGATGNFYLYQSPSTLLATINATDTEVSVTGDDQVTVDITGYITEPLTDYYFSFESDFVRDLDGLSSSSSTTINFTTTSAPHVSTSSPADGSSNVTNNQTFTWTWSSAVTANSGYAKMYKAGSPATLLHSFDVTNTSEVTFSGSDMILDVSPYANQIDQTFYYLLDNQAVKDANGFKSAAITDVNAYRYTMTAGPVLENTLPANGATNVNENETVIFDFDQAITLGTGNIYIYKAGTVDTLIYTINVATSPRISITDNMLYIDVTGQFQRNQTYYFKTDAGIVTDQWGFRYRGISTTSEVRFTMSNADSLMEVANIKDTRRFISGASTTTLFDVQEFNDPQDGYTYSVTGSVFNSTTKKFGTHSFHPGTSGNLTAVPGTAISHTGDFTIEFWYLTPTGVTDAGYIMDTRNSSNTSEWNIYKDVGYISIVIGSTGVYQCPVGSINSWHHYAFVRKDGWVTAYKDGVAQANPGYDTAAFKIFTTGGLKLGANYANSFTMDGYMDDFSIETKAKYTANFSVATSKLIANEETSMIAFNFDFVDGSYYTIRKQVNNVTPSISDLDIDSGLTYTSTLIAGHHKLSYNGSTPDYVLTLSGTKSEVNAMFADVLLHPQGTYNNEYITYIQTRNGEVREQEQFLLLEVGFGPEPTPSATVYVYTSNATFTPPSDLLADGLVADILIVGGGGGGSIGGGAGGQVVQLTNQTLSNTGYPIVIGSGGARGGYISSSWTDASNGTSTTAFGQTAYGGNGGKAAGYTGPGTGNANSIVAGGNRTPYTGGDGYIGYVSSPPLALVLGGGGANSTGNGGSVTGSPTISSPAGTGHSGTTTSIYPGTFARGGDGGHWRNIIIGTGTMGNDAGCGGAGGYTPLATDYTVDSGDGYPQAGKDGIVVIRFHV